MIENIKDYEEAIQKVQEILSCLQDDELTLKENVGLYREGMELINRLQDLLNEQEQVIETIDREFGKDIL